VMAFYGAPIEGDDDAERAIRSAIEMQQCFTQLRSEYSILEPLGLGVGVHSGEAIVGNIGSERVMDYTAIGDNVNISRRLQELARPGEILISEATQQLVSAAKVKHLGTQALPGRSEPVTIYSLQDF